jgi:hypothetical protein
VRVEQRAGLRGLAMPDGNAEGRDHHRAEHEAEVVRGLADADRRAVIEYLKTL